MAESQGKGLKTPVNGLFHKNFEFEPLFGYDNFQNKIDTWETTVLTKALHFYGSRKVPCEVGNLLKYSEYGIFSARFARNCLLWPYLHQKVE